ncbi:hypothetical protein NHX12_002200 [Muraenolepis orangiensis]|uniref:Reverse transcriptase domain-containing protein n=1 Tax=Muraenolepis orangiensis TaxID=630683 RepID=A0A9Q0E416_9TELE|nr:hypothetical protein NHX12_002200 [Muraenolepis orangiensis]
MLLSKVEKATLEYRLPSSSLLGFFTEGAALSLPKEVTWVPDWVCASLAKGDLSGAELDVLLHGRRNLPKPVESGELPSSNLVSQPIRQVLYGLLPALGRSGVEEVDWDGLDFHTVTVQPVVQGATQGLRLDSLPQADRTVRLKVCVETLGVNQETMEGVPPHLRLPVAVTCYWLRRAKPDLKLLKALLMVMIQGELNRQKGLTTEFTAEELSEAMSKLKPGKSPGRDNIHPEFVIHQSTTTSGWLCAFYTSCYQRLKLPKTSRRDSVIALPKPTKPAEDPKSYRPISLLCVPFKILERMVHSRIEPVVDSQLPREQAGFRRGRSTADQVTQLCQDIENSFQDNEKAGVVYLDLTAAYDTVWHRGLHLKLLRTIPDRHMVKFIMETLSNRSFILQTSSGQCSRLRRLKNGVPQGSVLSPMLFNVYIHDLPDTASRKYGYADDLAIMLSRPTWKAMEEGLNEDMGTLVAYLRRWRLQLSVGKSVAAAYHLSTREARRELEVHVDNKCLEVQQAPKYLGVRLDRTLSFKQHLEEVKAKVTSRVALIRRLAGTTWGASAKTLRISTQALVFSAAEYCAPVWSKSPHARKSSWE